MALFLGSEETPPDPVTVVMPHFGELPNGICCWSLRGIIFQEIIFWDNLFLAQKISFCCSTDGTFLSDIYCCHSWGPGHIAQSKWNHFWSGSQTQPHFRWDLNPQSSDWNHTPSFRTSETQFILSWCRKHSAWGKVISTKWT